MLSQRKQAMMVRQIEGWSHLTYLTYYSCVEPFFYRNLIPALHARLRHNSHDRLNMCLRRCLQKYKPCFLDSNRSPTFSQQLSKSAIESTKKLLTALTTQTRRQPHHAD